MVSSGETDNGIVGYVDSNGDGEAEIFTKNKITVDMFCNPFYQENEIKSITYFSVFLSTLKRKGRWIKWRLFRLH